MLLRADVIASIETAICTPFPNTNGKKHRGMQTHVTEGMIKNAGFFLV